MSLIRKKYSLAFFYYQFPTSPVFYWTFRNLTRVCIPVQDPKICQLIKGLQKPRLHVHVLEDKSLGINQLYVLICWLYNKLFVSKTLNLWITWLTYNISRNPEKTKILFFNSSETSTFSFPKFYWILFVSEDWNWCSILKKP